MTEPLARTAVSEQEQLQQSKKARRDQKIFRRLLARFGFTKSILILTLVCTICATSLSVILRVFVFGQPFDFDVPLNAFLVTIILCPIFSSFIVATTLDLHHLESHMRYLASYDMLTDVLTRRLFFSNANRLYAIANRTHMNFSVAYIDIDDFKSINDEHGHHAGDEVLRACAQLLKSQLRKSDIVGRIGGEEFAICLLDTKLNDAEHLMNQIRLVAKARGVEYNRETIHFTISVGLTHVDSYPNEELQVLIDQADTALYQAKEKGKDRVMVYNAD